MTIFSAISRQPWRITLAVNGVPPVIAGSYTVVRKDGGYSSVSVTNAWLVGTNTAELSLSDQLAPNVVYVVSIPASSTSHDVTTGPLSPAPAPLAYGEDPEAEAYGIDANWFSGRLTGDGDIVEAKGRQCLFDDLACIASIEPGEIFHRPNDGGGLPAEVNGPSIDSELGKMRANLKRQWLKDTRVAAVDAIQFNVQSTGKIFFNANITDRVTGDQFTVSRVNNS